MFVWTVNKLFPWLRNFVLRDGVGTGSSESFELKPPSAWDIVLERWCGFWQQWILWVKATVSVGRCVREMVWVMGAWLFWVKATVSVGRCVREMVWVIGAWLFWVKATISVGRCVERWCGFWEQWIFWLKAAVSPRGTWDPRFHSPSMRHTCFKTYRLGNGNFVCHQWVGGRFR